MKLFSTIIISIGLVFAIGCGKKDEDKKGTDDKAGNGDKAAPGGDTKPAAKPAAAAAKASPAMVAFMTDLKGKSDDVTAALKTHGKAGLESDMDMYDLNTPKVVSVAGDCQTMEAKAGMTTRTFVICWKDGKIDSIENKGMK